MLQNRTNVVSVCAGPAWILHFLKSANVMASAACANLNPQLVWIHKIKKNQTNKWQTHLVQIAWHQ